MSMLRLLVGHAIETLLAGKANLLCNLQTQAARGVLSSLEHFGKALQVRVRRERWARRAQRAARSAGRR